MLATVWGKEEPLLTDGESSASATMEMSMKFTRVLITHVTKNTVL